MAGDAELVGERENGPRDHGSKREKHRENKGSTANSPRDFLAVVGEATTSGSTAGHRRVRRLGFHGDVVALDVRQRELGFGMGTTRTDARLL